MKAFKYNKADCTDTWIHFDADGVLENVWCISYIGQHRYHSIQMTECKSWDFEDFTKRVTFREVTSQNDFTFGTISRWYIYKVGTFVSVK